MTGVTLLGAPWDGSSSFQRGAALAPPLIRAALSSSSSNLWNERGDDLGADGVLADAGDLTLPDPASKARARPPSSSSSAARVRLLIMCGLAGYLSRKGVPPDYTLLEALFAPIRARGPDDEGLCFISRPAAQVRELHTPRSVSHCLA